MKNIINKILIISLLATLIGCQSEVDPHAGHNHAAGEHDEHEGHQHEEEVPDNEVHLLNAQVKTIGVELGGFMNQKMSDFISVTGTLDVPPNSVSSVHVKEGGFIRNLTKIVVGSYVKKGSTIATLEHSSFIQKQQEYLEIRSEMIYLNQEMERQQRLSEANASALKNYQKAQSDYRVKQVQLKGIEQYLSYLGIDLENLKNEKITRQIAIIAPSSGYVSVVNVHNGMFAQPETELVKIVSDEHIHIELEVFEKDIHRVKKGQKITFELPSNPGETFEGKVYLIAPTFENEKKTVHVHAHIIGRKPTFRQGGFVNARIWENEATVPCLPEKAVVIADNIAYIFVQKKKMPSEIQYTRIPVKVKQKKDGWISVDLMETLPKRGKDKIVQNAAFYLIAEMNKGDAAHSHSH
ncbi:MAG: efflux RND transporter periplasmic adaptor subunit [Saprospiraceae bacterium]